MSFSEHLAHFQDIFIVYHADYLRLVEVIDKIAVEASVPTGFLNSVCWVGVNSPSGFGNTQGAVRCIR